MYENIGLPVPVHVPLRSRTFSSSQRHKKIIKIPGLMVSLRNDYVSLLIVIIRASEVTFNYIVRIIVALGRDFQKSNRSIILERSFLNELLLYPTRPSRANTPCNNPQASSSFIFLIGFCLKNRMCTL